MEIVAAPRWATLIDIEIPSYRYSGGWQSQPISEAQKASLHRYGLGWAGLTTKGQASFVLSIVGFREKHGLATPGQLVALKSVGATNLAQITKTDAARILKSRYRSKCPEFVLAARTG